jgi:hypothetical protein
MAFWGAVFDKLWPWPAEEPGAALPTSPTLAGKKNIWDHRHHTGELDWHQAVLALVFVAMAAVISMLYFGDWRYTDGKFKQKKAKSR